MATRKAGGTTRPGSGGTKSRDKGTRGGRPEASATTAQRTGTRSARPGNGQRTERTGNAQRAGNGQSERSRSASATLAEPTTTPVPAWLQWTTWVLSLAGLGVSVYVTIIHYTQGAGLLCPETSTINCAKVITGQYSVVLGIPVAVLGLVFYVFLAVANSPWAWRWEGPSLPRPFRSSQPALYWVRLGSMIVGIVFVLYLIYTELFTIGAICLWCTSVHVITFCLFCLIVFAAAAGYGLTKTRDYG
jgi:uncharacterized membrane protein